ncbi:MAG: chemotaxis protein CheW [Anaerolineae bacterium]|nr:chemotaxis protein CheW [Anaerolineae bacterium]
MMTSIRQRSGLSATKGKVATNAAGKHVAAPQTFGPVPEGQTLVVFRLAEQMYAIPIPDIVQILEMVTITPIPQIDPVVKGAINVRGEVVPVLSLRGYLNLAELSPALNTPIILVQVMKPGTPPVPQKLGLIVDEVLDVMRALDDTITPLPSILPEALHRAALVQGVVQTRQGMVILLALEALFAAEPALPTLAATLPDNTPEERPGG